MKKMLSLCALFLIMSGCAAKEVKPIKVDLNWQYCSVYGQNELMACLSMEEVMRLREALIRGCVQ